jgi:hypothetical protein
MSGRKRDPKGRHGAHRHHRRHGPPDFETVRARLNLLAVLPNLEDVVRLDPEMARLVAGSRVTVQFVVRGGPKAYVRIADGACTVGKGEAPAAAETPPDGAAAADAKVGDAQGGDAKVVLWFASPRHLNRMFDGTAQPVPLKGFKQLGFLRKQFTQLTDRMAYYLKPTDALLTDPAYLEMNTRLTLNTAACAVPVLLDGDPECAHLRHALDSGSIALKVLPDGPGVGLVLGPDEVRPVKGDVRGPSGLILMRDLPTANAYLNGKLDTFVAAVRGEIQIWGHIGKIEALGLVLDRVPKYLS